jgi:hypothetical protein
LPWLEDSNGTLREAEGEQLMTPSAGKAVSGKAVGKEPVSGKAVGKEPV